VHFYHSGQQVVETRTGDDSGGVPDPNQLAPRHQFVWSPRYIDSLILRDENTDGDGTCTDADDKRLFYLADAKYNVTAVVALNDQTETWHVAERYLYDPYGRVRVLNGDPAVDPDGQGDPSTYPEWSVDPGPDGQQGTADDGTTSDVSNTTLYTGRELDLETSLYYYRARYYHATLGRFLTRDPLLYSAGDQNLYRYVSDEGPSEIALSGPQRPVDLPEATRNLMLSGSAAARLGLVPPLAKPAPTPASKLRGQFQVKLASVAGSSLWASRATIWWYPTWDKWGAINAGVAQEASGPDCKHVRLYQIAEQRQAIWSPIDREVKYYKPRKWQWHIDPIADPGGADLYDWVQGAGMRDTSKVKLGPVPSGDFAMLVDDFGFYKDPNVSQRCLWQNFETCAVCIDGNSKHDGEIFGCVRWGHTVASRHTPPPISLSESVVGRTAIQRALGCEQR